MNNILVVYGTRPEEIKLYPFTKYAGFEFLEVNQSKDLHQDLINAKYRCHEDMLESMIADMKPRAVMVQGDTRTAFRSALYAFENKIPVIHVEAGLRTFDLAQPFPEEGYRQMIDCIATYKYCSRIEAAKNCNGLFVGQTSIDTLHEFCGKVIEGDYLIVTLHRNENLKRIPTLVKQIKNAGKDFNLKVFAHPNKIGQCLRKHFACLDPLPYVSFIQMLAGCYGVMTDSGGLQEEAISLGKPCYVMREKSERSNDDYYLRGATEKIVQDLEKRGIWQQS